MTTFAAPWTGGIFEGTGNGSRGPGSEVGPSSQAFDEPPARNIYKVFESAPYPLTRFLSFVESLSLAFGEIS